MNTKRFRFPKDIILLSVPWYLRFGLSYRDLEEILEEHGVFLDHITIFRWVIRFTPFLLSAFQKKKRSVGGRWRMDETYVKVNGKDRYLLKKGQLKTPKKGASMSFANQFYSLAA